MLERSGRPSAPDARRAERPAGAGRRGAPRLRDHAGGTGEDRREGAAGAGHALRGDQAPEGGRHDRGVRGEARPRGGRRAAPILPPHRLRGRGPGGRGRKARRSGARRAPEGRLPRAEAEPGGGVMASLRGHERAVGTSERAYRSLLRAFPRELRDEYGHEMARCFRDLCREALGDGGGFGLAALWARTLTELFYTALKERSPMLNRNTYRSVGVALAAGFLFVWGNAALGITDSDADLMFFLWVPTVGILGAIIARFQPRGMARAMFATALTLALVAVIALIAGIVPAYNSAFEVLGITGFYVALFVGSALLFRHAAREQTPVGAGPEG